MSYTTQAANMKKLAKLLSQDLGYVWGARESGPNGAKRDFLIKGRAFMSALGKDIGLLEPEVYVNKAGIAVSGEVYLKGMWTEQYGLFMWLEQDLMHKNCICYRTIRLKSSSESNPKYSGQKRKEHKSFEHGHNNFISLAFLAEGNYEALLQIFMGMRGVAHERKAA